MSDQTIKRTISGIIILALFSLPLILPSNAFAANNTSNSTTGLNWSSPNSKNPYKMDASTLLNANNLMAIVGCTGIIDTATDAAMKLATKVISKLLKLEQTVPVVDNATASELKKTNKREACFNGLAYALARQQLVSMTKSTMNWVNTGFSGDPLYVRNITSLTRNIESEILEKELDLFKSVEYNRGYPYGKTFAQSQIRAYKSINSADSMKADLTNYLSDGATIDSFSNNFSQGGWGGWLALTQKSNNNPIGYSIEKSQQIADKQEKEVTATKEEVKQNGGFLDQKKCAEYGKKIIKGTGNLVDMTVTDPEKCVRYETVTPGSMIRDKVSKYLNSPETQLELADSLNEVLYSIFGNLIARLQQKGLASLSSNTEDFSGVSGGIGANRIVDENGDDITSGSSGSGYDVDESFDITKDLEGILADQAKYITTVEKLFPPLINVMTDLGELDYCIPGPNPSWQTNSSNTKDAYLSYLNNITVVNPDDARYWIVEPAEDRRPELETAAQKNVFQNYLDNINNSVTGFWTTLQSSWYFRDQLMAETWEFGANANGAVSTIIDSRTNQIDNTEAEYKVAADKLYGFNSPMQTEYLDNGLDTMRPNPEYLPMAQAGLNITKDINSYNESISELIDSYQKRIIETRSNIYKLKKISEGVNTIVLAAQKRRDAARALAGEPAITKECKANERTIITQ